MITWFKLKLLFLLKEGEVEEKANDQLEDIKEEFANEVS